MTHPARIARSSNASPAPDIIACPARHPAPLLRPSGPGKARRRGRKPALTLTLSPHAERGLRSGLVAVIETSKLSIAPLSRPLPPRGGGGRGRGGLRASYARNHASSRRSSRSPHLLFGRVCACG